jgi:zinc/manganese transport system substrate-binding protein
VKINLSIKRCVCLRVGMGLSLLAFIWVSPGVAAGRPITVVAAENIYGDIARRIGGEHVSVTSILNTPAQDPHLFELAAGAARELADAQIVVINGAGYDPWTEKLLKAAPRMGRIVIDVAKLRGVNAGDNPHLWYDPTTMPAVAGTLAEAFVKADPTHDADYRARLGTTLTALARIDQRVAQMKARYAGVPVTATESAFVPMARAIGLTMRNERFQQATANGTEPSARDIAAIENDLKQRKVKALIYNKQVSDSLAQRLREVALQAAIPVVGITETCPAHQSFDDWMLGELDALDNALAHDSHS